DGDNPGPAPILVMPDPPHPPPTTPQFIPSRDREGVVTPSAKTSPQTPESSETTPPVPQVLTRQPRHAARRLSRPHRPQHRHREHFGRANTYLIQRSPLLAQGDSEGDVAIGHGVYRRNGARHAEACQRREFVGLHAVEHGISCHH